MSDSKTPAQEPSMEEILASIRRIISEDGEAGKAPPDAPAVPAPPAAAAPAGKKPAAQPAPAPAPPPPPPPKQDDVLELTEMVADDGKVTDLTEPEPAPAPPPPAPEPPPAPVAARALGVDEGLVSAMAAKATADALADLQAMTKIDDAGDSRAAAGGLALGDGGVTLEEMVRDALRPLLKTWLDENLPGLVERMVQKEIKRITRQVDET